MADRTLEEAEQELAQLKDGLTASQGKMKHVAYSGVTKALENREVEVIISANTEDRDKDVVETAGIMLANYNRNPVVLFQHNPNMPVARTMQLNLFSDRLVAKARFLPEGKSEKADEVYASIQAEIINAASIGFVPKEWAPRNPDAPWGGQHYKKVDLLEWSFVTIPANPDALIISRSFGHGVGKFFSWADESGLCFGQLIGAEEKGLALTVWAEADGKFGPTETVKEFSAEEAATALAPFEGFSNAQDEQGVSGCLGGANASNAIASRLRAIKALRLRAI